MVAFLHIMADYQVAVFLNDVYIDTLNVMGSTMYHGGPLRTMLSQGINTLSLRVVNTGGDAGVLASLLAADNQTVLIHTNSTWTYTIVPLPSPLGRTTALE